SVFRSGLGDRAIAGKVGTDFPFAIAWKLEDRVSAISRKRNPAVSSHEEGILAMPWFGQGFCQNSAPGDERPARSAFKSIGFRGGGALTYARTLPKRGQAHEEIDAEG